MRYEPRDQGLGLSLLVYVGALVLGLGLIVSPVLWAAGPTEYQNPELPKYDITSSRPLATQHRQIPLARLKREEIVDQTMLAALNARAAKTREARERPARRPTHTAYAQAQAHDDEAPQQRPRRSGFFFSLF
jgi:hypothetical protein